MRKSLLISLSVTMVACGDDAGGSADVSDSVTLDVRLDDVNSPDSTSSDVRAEALDDCDGVAAVLTVSTSAPPARLDTIRGDASVRGYLDRCDGSPQRVQVHLGCGGDFSLTVGGRSDAAFSARVTVPEVDPSVELNLNTGSDDDARGILTLESWRDIDASGDVTVDIEVSCSGGGPGAWSLHIDGPSRYAVPVGGNGYPVGIEPTGDAPIGCSLGETPASVGRLLDENGARAELSQFYGEMVLIELGMMWCEPCRTFATRASRLQATADAESDEYGVSVISILAEDLDGRVTDVDDLQWWNASFAGDTPVFGGSAALELALICEPGVFPSFYVLDPNLVVRDVIIGPESDEALLARIRRAWTDFHAEHPEWVSPRCHGVLDAGDTCGCIDDGSSADNDSDTIPDACDLCDGADDTVDNVITGMPQMCVPPGDGYRQPSRFSFGAQFVHETDDDRLTDALDPERLVSVTRIIELKLYDDELICTITRHAISEVRTPGFDTGDFSQFASLLLDSTNSRFTHDCTNRLDPAEWGIDIESTLESVAWGFAAVDSCPLPGCAGSDDEIWELSRPTEASDVDRCRPWIERCDEAMIGIVPYLSNHGMFGEPSALTGVGWALELDAAAVIAPGWNWIPSSTLRSGYVRALFQGSAELDAPSGSLADFLSRSDTQ